MSAPSKLLENLVASQKIRHNGNKLLTNHAMNVSIKTDPAGNIRPVKNFKNSVQRVDGIVALIMGLAGASTFQPEEAKPVPQIFVM
jgi:phage terminase large subunit-like protein